jgi:hypothetical protein
MCFLIYSCKSYSQDLSLDVNNYYGIWQLQTRDNQDELIPTNNYYIFNTDGTVIERNIGSPDTLYKFKIEKIEDPVNLGTFYSNLLIIDINDPSIIYSYAPDLFLNNSDNKLYLHLEYQVNLKNSTYIKIN